MDGPARMKAVSPDGSRVYGNTPMARSTRASSSAPASDVAAAAFFASGTHSPESMQRCRCTRASSGGSLAIASCSIPMSLVSKHFCSSSGNDSNTSTGSNPPGPSRALRSSSSCSSINFCSFSYALVRYVCHQFVLFLHLQLDAPDDEIVWRIFAYQVVIFLQNMIQYVTLSSVNRNGKNMRENRSMLIARFSRIWAGVSFGMAEAGLHGGGGIVWMCGTGDRSSVLSCR
uniref:Uncharacterized protein n=1 Tax=Anopheles culicifacies TaxID=139723 RepID=A0A182LXP5_9DIPT